MPPNSKNLKPIKKDDENKTEKREYKLKVKVYEPRESVLMEITKEKHLLALYRLFVTVFLTLLINFIFYNHFYKDGIVASFSIIGTSFRNLHICLVGWICVFLVSLLPYVGFVCWTKGKVQLIPNSFSAYVWNRLWLMAYFIYFLFKLYIPIWFTYKYNFGFSSSVVIGMETLRLLMKTYAFVRTNTPRIISANLIKELPKFSHYLFFLFAPALVYRDSYPRSNNPIRWKRVITLVLEFAMSIILFSIIFQRSFLNDFKNYGKTPYKWTDVALIMMTNSFYSIFAFVLTFYLLLHIWLNIWGEMLQFSDKLFYEDWWTSSSYARYYRTWNVVVHDWLYHYIYKDIYEIVFPGSKFMSKQIVFFISSLFHEYACSIALGFYLPVFMVMFFVAGNILSYIKFSSSFVGNIFLFYSLSIGSSMMFGVCTMEYFCRVNFVKEELTVDSFFTPKLLNCLSY